MGGSLQFKGLGQKLLGTFNMPLAADWNARNNLVWSSEIACEKLNERHSDKILHGSGLRPGKGIIYSNRPVQEIMRELGLIPNQDGNLWVYSQPWNDLLNNEGLAPIPIIYADLLMGDSRSINEAQKIEEWFLNHLMHG